MTVYEAIVDHCEMRRGLPDPESTTVDDWCARLAEDEYGVVNVTSDLSGIVRLPAGMTTDRGVFYFAVTFHPCDPPTTYAVWCD